MIRQLAIRVLKEMGLGAVALLVAAIVIAPVLWAINTIYDSAGLYALLVAVIVFGVVLLVYQARIRPRLP
jgi:archaellum biogenesis protein FlaJ (TadC family)